MAAAHSIPPPPSLEGSPAATGARETALVQGPQAPPPALAVTLNTAVARLPVELEVGVPVRNFRVAHLLSLEPGSVVESQWNHGEDLPLAAGSVHLAWTEFEVVDTQLAARLTRLA